jgi:hypothetical protein
MDGIDQQIHQNLLDLLRVGGRFGQDRIGDDADDQVAFDGQGLQHGHRTLGDGQQVRGVSPRERAWGERGPAAREVEQLANDVRDPVDLLADDVGGIAGVATQARFEAIMFARMSATPRGVPSSWAMPEASLPTVASRSAWRTCSCARRRSSVSAVKAWRVSTSRRHIAFISVASSPISSRWRITICPSTSPAPMRAAFSTSFSMGLPTNQIPSTVESTPTQITATSVSAKLRITVLRT